MQRNDEESRTIGIKRKFGSEEPAAEQPLAQQQIATPHARAPFGSPHASPAGTPPASPMRNTTPPASPSRYRTPPASPNRRTPASSARHYSQTPDSPQRIHSSGAASAAMPIPRFQTPPPGSPVRVRNIFASPPGSPERTLQLGGAAAPAAQLFYTPPREAAAPLLERKASPTPEQLFAQFSFDDDMDTALPPATALTPKELARINGRAEREKRSAERERKKAEAKKTPPSAEQRPPKRTKTIGDYNGDYSNQYQARSVEIRERERKEERFDDLGNVHTATSEYYFEPTNESKACARALLSHLWSDEQCKSTIEDSHLKKWRMKHTLSTPSCISFIIVDLAGKKHCFVSVSATGSQQNSDVFYAIEKVIKKGRDHIHEGYRFVLTDLPSENFHILINKGLSEEEKSEDPTRQCSEKSYCAELAKLFYQHGKTMKILGIENCALYPYKEDTEYGKDAQKHVSLPGRHNGQKIVSKTSEGQSYYTLSIPCCAHCQTNKMSVLRNFQHAQDTGHANAQRKNLYSSPLKAHTQAQLQSPAKPKAQPYHQQGIFAHPAAAAAAVERVTVGAAMMAGAAAMIAGAAAAITAENRSERRQDDIQMEDAPQQAAAPAPRQPAPAAVTEAPPIAMGDEEGEVDDIPEPPQRVHSALRKRLF